MFTTWSIHNEQSNGLLSKGCYFKRGFKGKSNQNRLSFFGKKHVDYNWSEYHFLLRLHKEIQGLATPQLPIDNDDYDVYHSSW